MRHGLGREVAVLQLQLGQRHLAFAGRVGAEVVGVGQAHGGVVAHLAGQLAQQEVVAGTGGLYGQLAQA